MFEDIDDKIKTLAVVVCILGMIASVIWGFMLFFRSFLSGLLVIALGCLGSWVGTFTLYGFGELIAETRRNREISQQLLTALKPPAAARADGIRQARHQRGQLHHSRCEGGG